MLFKQAVRLQANNKKAFEKLYKEAADMGDEDVQKLIDRINHSAKHKELVQGLPPKQVTYCDDAPLDQTLQMQPHSVELSGDLGS